MKNEKVMKVWNIDSQPLWVFPAIVIRAGSFKNTLTTLKKLPTSNMDYHPIAPLLGEERYEIWSIILKVFSHAMGYDIW